MRIAALRVDGYGVLADFAVEDLELGLTIFHGPNEAGKSTLLDFVRGVLFGFPDRRHRAPFHAPLRGGRHGGAVRLITDSGAELTIERHLDGKAPVCTWSDGTPGDPSEVAALLGHADATLFRSVFAFGLEELSQFESLERDEIRDLVFSAGVIGAGRSAGRATRALAQRRGDLVRPRTDAVANRLRRELDEIDAELRAARRAATELPARMRSVEELDARLNTARVAAEGARRRLATLDALRRAAPIARRRAQASAELSRIGVDEHALVEVASDVDRLVEERSGHDRLVQQRAEQTAKAADLETGIVETRTLLGLAPDATLPRWSDEASRRATELLETHRELGAAQRAAEDRRLAAARALANLTADAPTLDARPLDAIRATRRELDQLRMHLRDRENAERAMVAVSPPRPLNVPFAMAIGVLLLSLFGALALASGTSRPPGAVVAGVGVIAVVAAVVSLVTVRRRQGATTPREDPRSQRSAREIARLAEAIGLVGELTETAVDGAARALEEEQEARRVIDDHERAVARAARDLDEAERSSADIGRRRQEIHAEAESIARAHGLGAAVDPAVLVAAFDRIGELVERTDALARLELERAHTDAEIDTFQRALADAACRSGLDVDVAECGTAVDALRAATTAARARAAETAALRRAVADAEADLAEIAGSGPDADRFLAELEHADPIGWESEMAVRASELEGLDREVDEAATALRDATRVLEEIRASDVVAELELRRAGMATSLDEALREWVTLGIAEALLHDTLERYERERQPAVIALASTLFARVTDARYVGLVPREDPDNPRRRAIEVVAANGSRLAAADLSRGTAEQLYLCLRLAFASTFAERAVALPFVLDDVLVNFDPERAAAVAGAIATTAADHQVLAFTCHPHVVDHLLRASEGRARVVELRRA